MRLIKRIENRNRNKNKIELLLFCVLILTQYSTVFVTHCFTIVSESDTHLLTIQDVQRSPRKKAFPQKVANISPIDECEEQEERTCAMMWPNIWGRQNASNTDIRTFDIDRSQALNEALASNAQISLAHANELISVGAVSVKGALYDDMGELIPKSSSSWRHVLEPTCVEEGSKIKVFLTPRLYPSCYCQDWEARLLHESEEMIIVDKPSMLPCQPHQSNYMHSAPRCVQKALYSGKKEQPLYLCHRLDTVTEGCLVLAKTKAMVNRFVIWSTSGQISKEYLALTTQPVEPGIIEHYMYFGEEFVGPKLLRQGRPRRQEKKSDWKICKLEVLGCTEVDVNQKALDQAKKDFQKANERNGDWKQPKFYEVKVKLMTGRTHQVRAQLAALHAPIVGDDLYIPMKGLVLQMTDGSESKDEEVFAAIEKCDFPSNPIGLQAERIFLPGTKGVDIDVKASSPWWHHVSTCL